MQDWHIGCSFGVKGNEGRTMLWSGTRSGDTTADLIFCLAFLRLQMTLEERFDCQCLKQPKRSRRRGVRGQGLAGCGVRLVDVPNDVWILEALMTAMPPVLPSAPMPALLVAQCLDDFDWTAGAAFSCRWWNGGRDDPISLGKGKCVAFWPRTCCTISETCMAWLCTRCFLF